MSIALRSLAIPCVTVASLMIGCGDKQSAQSEASDPVSAFNESKMKIAKLSVDRFAMVDMPQWQLLTNKACPESLQTLAKESARSPQDLVDPWGTPYEMFCGPSLPPEVRSGIGVMSYGPDRKKGTADDIASWKKLL